MSMQTIEDCFQADFADGFGFPVNDGGRLLLAEILRPTRSRKEMKKLQDSEETGQTIRLALRSASRSETVEVKEIGGKKQVSVHFSEWALIPSIFRAILSTGHVAYLTGNLGGVVFEGGEEFSFETAEEKLVALLREEHKYRKSWWNVDMGRNKGRVLRKHYNWRTDAGKKLCDDFRDELCKTEVAAKDGRYADSAYDRLCSAHGVLHRGGWSAFVPSIKSADQLLTVAQPTVEPVPPQQEAAPASAAKKQTVAEPLSAAEEDADVENQCHICLHAAADTVAMPCRHRVVCGPCSRLLEKSNDAKICVQCRCKIDSVIYNAN